MSRLVSAFKTFGQRLSSISLPPLPEKLRGGSIERGMEYLKNVVNDYKQVMIDTKDECRHRPLKASVYVSLMSAFGYCMATNPNEKDLTQQLVECHNLLSAVPKSITNTNSCDFVLYLNQLVNEKLLIHQSFGFFSVLYLSDYPEDCCLYENQCPYLRSTIKSYIFDRIVDIGLIGKYRLLDTKMIDYDINPLEWQTS
ncbi:uncharacterized protein LOC128960879 [Oppia nitens]|uniref:uncharacterized protein LOC128960879 n=1 Tax=Oppia nitens TaxID=1686743 RepID=UPI0023DBD9FD|nr:uncharacterized protein LOC128960879 [Oppia nitens]